MSVSRLPDIPGYTLVVALSQSDRAAVYLALPTAGGGEKVIKLTTPACQGEVLRHELAVLQSLSHPLLSAPVGAGILGSQAYMVMDYWPGHSLDHRRFEMDLVSLLAVLQRLAPALDDMADRGYFTANLAPEHILLGGVDTSPRLIGFRPGQQIPPESWLPSEMPFWAPERLRGMPLDGRAYVYSLGMLLYLLVAGRLPDGMGQTSTALMAWQDEERPPRLPDHLAAFQPLIDKSLCREPAERYARATCLAEALAGLDPGVLANAEQGSERSLLIQGRSLTVQTLPEAMNALSSEPPLPETPFTPEHLYDVPRDHHAVVPRPLVWGVAVAVVLLAMYWLARGPSPPRMASNLTAPPLEKAAFETFQSKTFQRETFQSETFQSLEQQAMPLRIAVEKDMALAEDLVVIYRAALRGEDPAEQSFGRRGLQDLQEIFVRQFDERRAEGDDAGVIRLHGQLEQLFDEGELLPELRQRLLDMPEQGVQEPILLWR